MKKVAVVAHGLNNGGAERVASILANYLAKKGYPTLFIAVYSEGREYYLEDSVETVFIKTIKHDKVSRLLSRNQQIYRALKEFNVDTVFAFVVNELLLSEMKGISIVFSLRNHPEFVDNSFLAAYLRKYAFNNAKNIVFQTLGAARFFSAKIQARGLIIYNPLDTKKIPYWLECDRHEKIFITACRLTEQKNLKMMINAFDRFHMLHQDYSLNIYGDGELKQQLENQIKALKAGTYIKLCGHSTEIYNIMKKSTAFILSSNYEGLSNSMLEALAIGLPCICTDCPPGGASAFIEDGVNGNLVPVGDEEALVVAMKNLVEEEGLLEKYSKNSIKIRSQLEADKICAQWESLI